MAVEARPFGRDILFIDESVQMGAQLGAVVRRHAAANAYGKMIAAWERPDVALELGQKFNNNRVGGLRDEIALGHFQFVALKRARFRMEVIASASGEHQKIGGLPFAFEAIAWLFTRSIDAHDVRALNLAARFFGASEKHAIEHGARVNDDGMTHVESHALPDAADELDGADELLGIRIVEEKRETLDGFVGQAAAAGLFPGEMLVKNTDAMPGARKLLAAHGAGWAAADDGNFRHLRVSLSPAIRSWARKQVKAGRIPDRFR